MEGDINFINAANTDISFEDSNGIKQNGILVIDPQATRVLSDSRTAFVVTSFENNEIAKGNAFQVHRRFTIPTTGRKIAIDFTGITNKAIFTLPIRFNTDEGQVFVDTYKVTTKAGGTIIPSINRNSLSINTADAIFTDGITSSDVAGDDLREYIIGTQSAFFNPGGGGGGGVHPKIFDPEILLIDVENRETSEIILEVNFNWYEVPEE